MALVTGTTQAGPEPGTAPKPAAKDALPSLAEVSEGFTKVIPADGGAKSLYTLYTKDGSRDILAVLPPDFEKQMLLLGTSLSRGVPTAGIQGDSYMVRWKRYGNRLGLVSPQLAYRTSGDDESRRGVERLFTDAVLLDVPIIAEGDNHAPVIALDDLLVDESLFFFQWNPGGLVYRMASVEKVKVFEKNLTVGFEVPWKTSGIGGSDTGNLMTIAYSMSLLPDTAAYTPRKADQRVGYFITAWDDFARIGDPTTRQRYIKRWKLEKADPKLSMSPAKEPIVFYIDHKTPVRYRRWVREGVLEWNKAFEKVGIVGAIEAYQQDAATGAHMDKDPESIDNNFVVWNTNDISFAIGPCRVDPRNGRILDADVVMNDGWLRYAADTYRKYLASSMTEGLGQETLSWLGERPRWDPRVRLGVGGVESPEAVFAGAAPLHGAALLSSGQACAQSDCRALDLAMVRSSLLDLECPPGDLLDGAPEDFVGRMIKDVVMHEIGHVLGLRHNFAGSGCYTLAQINSPEWRDGLKPIGSSVMDYNPINFNTDESRVQGPYFMPTLGEYDLWAIRYGYAPDADLEAILKESAAPEHRFLTDEDLYGPDPAARTRDLGNDTLDFVDGEMALVQRLRARILDRALKPGESFARAREAYITLLGMQTRDVNTLARYVGGVTTRRDRVGDADRNPVEQVSAAQQRRALAQIDRYIFRDDAFGLAPDLLAKMSFDRWFDGASIPQDFPDPQLDVHDLVLGAQASALTLLLNPAKLRRVYDCEFRTPPGQDALTVAELLAAVQDAIWSELSADVAGKRDARHPFISSLRRNLQREHLERMIDLTMPGGMDGAVGKCVSPLAARQLRQLDARIAATLKNGEALDPYTAAHLEDARNRIRLAQDAMYVYK